MTFLSGASSAVLSFFRVGRGWGGFSLSHKSLFLGGRVVLMGRVVVVGEIYYKFPLIKYYLYSLLFYCIL